MSQFPSRLLCIVIYAFTFNLYTGCDNTSPLSQLQAPSFMPAPEATQPTMVSTAPQIEEVLLDPMLIVPHSSDIEPVLGIVSEESEALACKMAGDFLVVPLLSDASTYFNCSDRQETIYLMKLVNCTKEKIAFSTFAFTLTLPSKQAEGSKNGLADEFTHFELHVDNDQTSYLSTFKPVDSKTGIVSVDELAIEVEADEELFCRLKVLRRCSNNGDPFEFTLDLTGASVSKADEDSVPVNGAVLDKPDRQVTFMSRD